ncbi:MAG TPA: AAA family ATPase [Candidatus Nanoarchaeia archaeon]|nr:AAA family ATPase [Candidatus Nanoarchaeia archaeon]
MQIKKIILKNIRSYDHEEIELPDGSTLLCGDIGSGKTSILLAIEFALFGLQPGQRGSGLLKNGKDNGGATIEFEVSNKQIIIERTLKRSKTISQDYCSISIDGEKKEISVTELKNLVLDLLNYPKEFSKKQNILYKFTVYTPQEEMKQIILEDAKVRMNTLRHVFGIDKYKRILENALIVTSKLREERRVKEALTLTLEDDKLNIVQKEDELETKGYSLESIEKELFIKQEARRKVQEEKDKIIEKTEEKRKYEQEIEKTKIFISSKNESIISNQSTMSQLKTQIESLSSMVFDKSQIVDLENHLNINKKEREKLSEKNLQISSEMASLKMKIEESKKLEQKISNLEVCPTCLQEIDALYRANVLNKTHNEISYAFNKIQDIEIDKKQLLEKIQKIDLDMSEIQKKIYDLNLLKIKLESIKEKQSRLEDLKNINEMLEKDVSLLKTQIESLRSKSFELAKYDIILEKKQKELDQALKEEKIIEIKSAELKKEIELFTRQIEELKEKTKSTEEIKKQLDYLINLEEWLSKKFIPVISNIERNVMVHLKAEFSKLLSEWFSMLVSDNFNILLDDEFTPVVEQHDYEIDYNYLSGGERTAIALAYRLALNQIINSLLSKIKTKDLVILDEPTDGFSEQQLDKMRGVLDQLNVKQLIIVSHEQKIEGFVENVIKLKKENGISKKEAVDI